MPVPTSLAALEADLARDLRLLNYPPKGWVPETSATDGRPVSDVIVAGGGMLGLTVSFALRRQGIERLRLLDRAEAGREGPWVTYARMRTLRSPNHLTGPAMGLPALTFRAWYEAQHGAEAWAGLGKIPRAMWMDYLVWYRRVLSLPVENGVRLAAIRPAPHGLDCDLIHADGHRETAACRKLVLATGREGQARPRIPAALAPFFGQGVQHTSDDIDFAALHGKDVAVIGLSASAMDNAASALEAGARQVTLLARAPAVPRINKAKGIVYGGFTHGFPTLAPDWRLKLLDYIGSYRVAPPRDSLLRVFRHENAALWLDAPVTEVRREGGRFCLATPKGSLPADHVILGTGFAIDLAAPAELADHAPLIRTHADLLAERAGDAQAEWLAFPALSPSFQFVEREAGSAPYLGDIYCFTYAAAMTHGNVSGDIPAVSEGAERLAQGLAADLFRAGIETHWQAMQAFDDPELFGDELPDGTPWWPPLDDTP
ncbi:MAG: NAD(P)/FAD-dependent oxidoreductase [Alphaproteobacteria bacterium]|nr:NAD(P)/FAD-dependent oxidoreductase [Alphaproteobacteria bacterium]MCB9928504.1 NAD(P)/FAD-dependent oxidoreductase [Alphaproteobacteria bacterium]